MNDSGLKGKIEQKYWKSKQKVIEKLGKDQDEFVIAGDAEVDARLEVSFFTTMGNMYGFVQKCSKNYYLSNLELSICWPIIVKNVYNTQLYNLFYFISNNYF